MASPLQTELTFARKAIAEHWKRCEAAGLPHTSQNLAPVLDALTSYIATLEQLPEGHGDSPVLDAMHKFYYAVQALNDEYGQSLLETDERELIVPILIKCAELAGVDPTNYDGEPGGEFRDF